MSPLRGILNPNISREEEQEAWDLYHQAAIESITKRAKALEAASSKLVLSPEAAEALGRVSPELAWLQIREAFQGAIQDYPEASESLAKYENLPESLESLGGSLGSFNPVKAINYLVESNPDLSLQDIPHLPPLTILRALLTTMLTNDNLLSP